MSEKNQIAGNDIKEKFSAALMMFKQLPFVYFLAILALLYIANAHCAERKLRRIEITKKELKELRWKYITANADLMYSSTESYVERRVRPADIEVSEVKPQIIKAD